MDIQGLHYWNPSTWNQVIKPLKLACAQAMGSVAGDLMRRLHAENKVHDCRVPLLLEALANGKTGVVASTLLALQSSKAYLSRTFPASSEGMSLYDLAVDLALALGQQQEAASEAQGGPPLGLSMMAKKLARLDDPTRLDHLCKVAFDVFVYLRSYLDLRLMRVHHGEGASVDWLDRKLRLIDTVQCECLRFLDSWHNHPQLASLVVGICVDPRVQPLLLRRALRDRRLPAAWLMAWDQHYVHIRVEVARLGGAPLSDEAEKKLKPPISSKRGDTIRFEADVIQDLLDALARMHRQGTVSNGTARVDMMATVMRVRAATTSDDLYTSIEAAPDAHALFERIDKLAEAHNMRFAELEEAEATEDEDDLQDDSPEAEALDAADDSVLDQPSEPQASGPPRHIAGRVVAAQASSGGLTERCLQHLPLALRVGVLLKAAQQIADLPARKTLCDELQAQYIVESVFDELNVKPLLSAITSKALAAHALNARAERGISVVEFEAERDRAYTEFVKCAKQCLAQQRGHGQ